VRNRSGALAVADAFGLLPAPSSTTNDVVSLVTRPTAIPPPGFSRDMAHEAPSKPACHIA
jgi:hypothetical protein